MDLAALSKILKVKTTKYIPHKPTPKQTAFLMLNNREALYGGAAGGGKSDALLMGALQYVDVPGFSALLLRKTLTDLMLPQAILFRMIEWMQPWLKTKEVVYQPGKNHMFRFPTYDRAGRRTQDATIIFGYIGELNAYTRYQGAEFQYVAFDEVTQHNEEDYSYLFSRLRKCVCEEHATKFDPHCEVCVKINSLPLRIRGATNPGGVGHQWIMERYKINKSKDYEQASAKGEDIASYVLRTKKPPYVGYNPDAPFIPSHLWDNPYINVKEYDESLEHLTEGARLQLKFGDWEFTANSRFQKPWMRYYSITGELLFFSPNLMGRNIDLRNDVAEVFQTVDVASSLKEGPGDVEVGGAKKRSWTVISTWILTTCYRLLWVHMERFRYEIPDVVAELKAGHSRWRPTKILIEQNGIGRGVLQYANRMGLEVQGVITDRDKITNSTNAVMAMKNGRIFLPQEESEWKQQVQREIFAWQGHESEPDDIVDTLSTAANYVNWELAPDSDPNDYFAVNDTAAYADIPRAITPKSLYLQN